jgi:hypothetical protein
MLQSGILYCKTISMTWKIIRLFSIEDISCQCLCENKFPKLFQLSRKILLKINLNRIPILILLRHKKNFTATLINNSLWIGNPPRALLSQYSKFQPDGYQIIMKLCQNIFLCSWLSPYA